MKHKTRKAATKRFSLTKTGKLLRGVQYGRHLRSSKSKRQMRKYKKEETIKAAFQKKIKQML